MKKYSIFHVQGGIGKHVAATAVAKTIKNNHPDRDLIVVCVYTDIFEGLNFVDRVYPLGGTKYFYQEYVKDKDSILFHHEPYYTTNHIHKKSGLIENWCGIYNLEYSGEMPELYYNKLQKETASKFWQTEKPLMVLHTNGGLMQQNAKPYSWTRDMPESVGQALVDHYKEDYTIIQVTKNNSPKLNGAVPLFATAEQALSTKEFFTILFSSEKRVLIDSSLQHAAAALKKQSTVLWNGTSPMVFGYDIHHNIMPEIDFKVNLPGSYLFDFSFEGEDVEYPYEEGAEIYNVDKIIASVDEQ